MKAFRSLSLLGILALSYGCHTPAPAVALPTANAKMNAPLVAAGTTTDVANRAANAMDLNFNTRLASRDSKLVANINAAEDWNLLNPEGQPKVGVSNELTLARNRLSGVVADPEEVAAAANRRTLQLAGKLDEAHAAYNSANKQALDMASGIAAARAATEQAHKERDAAIASEAKAREEYFALLEANRAVNQKIIETITAEADKKVQDLRAAVWRQQALWLNIAGAACVVLFGVLCWIGGLAGAKSAWPFAVGGPLCWGLAQLVAEWWFKWAVFGVMAGGFVVGGIWLWKHLKLGEAKVVAEAKTAKVTAVLHDIVPVLDEAAKSDPATKAVLDEHVFAPLGDKMNDTEKQMVKQVRADVATPVPITS